MFTGLIEDVGRLAGRSRTGGAGKLIVEEAGGTVTDGDGAPLKTPLDVKQRFNLVASNGLSHDKLLELV